MPKSSEKSKMLDFLAKKTLMNLRDVDSSEEEEEILDEFFEDVTTVVCHRRAVQVIQPRLKSNYYKGINQRKADKLFADNVRIDSTEFEHILAKLRNNTIFKSESLQLPLRLQLQLILMRLCNDSQNISLRKISEIFDIGSGGTIVNVTRRVFKAILQLKRKIIKWPDVKERNKILQKTAHEMPGCIGYVKVLEMPLTDVPIKLRSLYYSHDLNQFAMKVQIVCDYLLKIRHVSNGYPGSISNDEIFSQCSLSKSPDYYFDTPQWLAGNGIEFSQSDIVITPFNENNNKVPADVRKNFNQCFAQYSGRIDKCFAELRQHFPSLNEIKYPVMNASSDVYCHQWILVCCILYNMIQELHASNEINTHEINNKVTNF